MRTQTKNRIRQELESACIKLSSVLSDILANQDPYYERHTKRIQHRGYSGQHPSKNYLIT